MPRDENWLNSALECSICLETIKDSKVLPCQHTFCRNCLEVIVASHKDRPLTCPECRLTCPANVKVDDLPPNVLLCRIIEGMKSTNLSKSVKTSLNQQQTAADATSTTSSAVPLPSTNNVPQFGHNTGSSNNALGTNSLSPQQPTPTPILHPRVPSGQQQQQQQQQPTPPPQSHNTLVPLSQIKDWRSVPHAKAIFDFHSRESGDLSFKRGDTIILKKRIDLNWSVGECNGKEGAFPINHVQVLVSLPTPKCKALYDFQMKPNEEEGCLTFKKGAIIHVIRRVDQNWAEGKLGETIGIFPISFVEMNLLARQLMIDAKSMAPNARTCPQPPIFEQNLSDSSTTTTTSTTSPSSENTTTSSNSSTAPNSPVVSPPVQPPPNNLVRIREAKHDKRHSLTALMGNGQNSNILMASNRHSAEILGIPDVTSAVGGGNSSNNKPTPEQKVRPHSQPHRTKKFVGGSRELFVAIYPYKPQKPDELELKKGFIYYITERCQDGWFKGINQRTQKSGVFPGNYVAPVRTRPSSSDSGSRKSSQTVTANSNTPAGSSSSSSSQQHSKTAAPAPELPPRNDNNNAASESSSSLWLFSRKSGDKSTQKNGEHSKTAASTKDSSAAKSLMKKLTSMKRSKSPTTFDNPSFEDTSLIQPSLNRAAAAPSTSAHPIHVRSGSCPSQLLQNLDQQHAQYFGSQRVKQKERPSMHNVRPNDHEASANMRTANKLNGGAQQVATANYQLTAMFHRKSQSLDANTIAQQMEGSAPKSGKPPGQRYRCILEYPPNSEYELELKVGDKVLVHKKRENGWMKGTHGATGKVGLFPASFVEPDV